MNPYSRWTLALSCVAYLWVAVINGYPVVYLDSGTYLRSAVTLYHAPVDRPLGYGWFIYLTSLNISPWLTVLAQSVIAVAIIARFITLLDPEQARRLLVLGVLATALFSSAPYFIGQLMPDFFSGPLPLAIFMMVVWYGRLSPMERIGLSLFVFGAVASHLSNLVIVPVVTVVTWFLHRVGASPAATGSSARQEALGVGGVCASVIVAWLAVSTTNYYEHRIFSASPGSHVYLLSRLLDDGPARAHLEHACPGAAYRLCAELENLPLGESEYIWDSPVLARVGGWLGSRDESRRIIAATLAEYPGAVISNAASAWARQFAAVGLGDLGPMPPSEWVTQVIERQYPGDIEEFRRSLQQQGKLESRIRRHHAPLIAAVFWVSLVVATAVALSERRRQRETFSVVVSVLVFLLVNACVVGALSGVHERYQSRAAWVVVLLASVLGVRRWLPRTSKHRTPTDQ